MNDEIITKTKKVSYSQYSLHSTCPKLYKLRYVDGLKDPPNIERVFGSAMHATVQDWLKKHFTEPPKNVKLLDLHDLFKTHFVEIFKEERLKDDGTFYDICSKETFTEYYLDGCEILDHVKQFKQFINEFRTYQFNQ